MKYSEIHISPKRSPSRPVLEVFCEERKGVGASLSKGVIQAPDLHLTGSQWASDHDHEWNNDNHDDNQIHGGCQHHDDSNDEDLSLTTIEMRCVFKKVFVDIFKERFE